jgi:hypothetical protein
MTGTWPRVQNLSASCPAGHGWANGGARWDEKQRGAQQRALQEACNRGSKFPRALRGMPSQCLQGVWYPQKQLANTHQSVGRVSGVAHPNMFLGGLRPWSFRISDALAIGGTESNYSYAWLRRGFWAAALDKSLDQIHILARGSIKYRANELRACQIASIFGLGTCSGRVSDSRNNSKQGIGSALRWVV